MTFSICVGTEACNARCGFCVAGMTPVAGSDKRKPLDFSRSRFIRACKFAQAQGHHTAMITGKGEPTLWPYLIDSYIDRAEPYFPIIELQTNGIRLPELQQRKGWLDGWHAVGLHTVALSVVSLDHAVNKATYAPHLTEYPELPDLIRLIHASELNVRLTFTGIQGGIDSVQSLEAALAFARAHDVEQVTWRPVTKPEDSRSPSILQFVDDVSIPSEVRSEIYYYFTTAGVVYEETSYGAKMLDYRGQNLCLTNCLTEEPERNLIWGHDGLVRRRWDLSGSVVL